MKTKRAKRRDRWREKERLRKLDQVVLAKIGQSMRLSMATWGGRRCAGCGKWVRPAYLAGDYTIAGNNIIISLLPYACKHVKCPGEKDWQ